MDDTTELSYEQRKPFRCKKCSNSFPTKHSLKLHTNTIHSKGMFECRKCDFRCDKIGKMTLHTQRHIQDERHSDPPDESHSNPPDESHSKSPDKHETQAKIPSLVIKLGKNILNIRQNSVVESQEDQQKFPNNDLDNEINDQKYFRADKVFSKSNGNFFCEICKKRFTQRVRFQKHMIAKHTEVKSIQIGSKLDGEHIRCLVCHKLFASKGILKRHILIHTGEMPFDCTKCDAKFNQNIRLQQHMKKDHGEGLFKCNKCDESFIQSIHLQRHVAAHTGKKPFSCTKCDASFAMHRDLKRHMILGHIQKKHFQCKKRGNKLILKRFVSKSMKKNHTTININITVNSEKYLKCMKCKESVKYSQLRSHMDMHQNAFRCDNCNRIFHSQHSLKIHRAKAHRGNSVNTDLDLEPEYKNSLSEETLGNQSPIDIDQNDFRCEICDRICHSIRSLNIHKAKAHKESNNNTDLDLEPEYKNTVIEEHTGNKSHIDIDQNDFRCEICNRICHSMRSLTIHKARAHKEYNNNTDLDLEPENKNTLSEENKNTLIEEHTDNKSHIDIDQNDFRCEICNRIWNSMRSLTIHKARAHKVYSNNIKITTLPEMSSEIDKEHKDTVDLKFAYQMQNSDMEDLKTEDKTWHVKSCEEGGKLKIKLQTNSRES